MRSSANTPFTPGKLTLLFLMLAAMPALLGTAAVAPALPLISIAFPDASETLISLIITLPPLATAVAGFLIGALSDRFGRVKVLVASLALFGCAGVSGYFLDSLTAIIFWRIWLGVGVAGLIPVVSTLIAEYYSGNTRARYLGYMSAAMGVGGLVLQTGCGALAEISWRDPFLIYLFGLLVIPGVLLFIREPRNTLVRESESELPLSERKPKTLPIRSILLVYLTLFLSLVMMYIVSAKLAYLLTQIGSVSSTVSGLLLGMVGLFSAASGFVFWRFAKHLTTMEIFAAMFFLEGLGLFLIGTAHALPVIALGTALVGFGLGLGSPTGSMWLSTATPTRYMGKVMGGMTVSIYGGIFASSFVGAELLAIAGNYNGLFLLIGAIGIGIAIVYFIAAELEKKYKKAHTT